MECSIFKTKSNFGYSIYCVLRGQEAQAIMVFFLHKTFV